MTVAVQSLSLAGLPAQRGVSAGTRRLAPPAPPKKAAPSGSGLFGIGTQRVGALAPAAMRSGTAKVRTSAPAAASAGTRVVRSGAHPRLLPHWRALDAVAGLQGRTHMQL